MLALHVRRWIALIICPELRYSAAVDRAVASWLQKERAALLDQEQGGSSVVAEPVLPSSVEPSLHAGNEALARTGVLPGSIGNDCQEGNLQNSALCGECIQPVVSQGHAGFSVSEQHADPIDVVAEAEGLSPKQQLLILGKAYARSVGRSLNRVAVRAGAHSRLFQTIEQGGGCHVDTLQRTFDWFAANWPADLEWPAEVPRPTKAKERAA